MGMPRFNVGDRVRILPVSPTPFVGLEGSVNEVGTHEHDITILDRYVVLFDLGEKQTFFDVQLVRLPIASAAAS
jgi:hypothetical protein